MVTEFIVMSSAAKMPSSCWGKYRRVALVEVEKGVRPKMISARAKGVIQIIQTWERLNVGTSNRCAYSVALAAANDLATIYNDLAFHNEPKVKQAA